MYIQETFINKDTHAIIGNTGIYEVHQQSKRRLFQDLRKAYGRCTGKIYVDTPEGKSIPRGWIFEARDRTADLTETCLREAWVTLYAHHPAPGAEESAPQGIIPEADIDRLLGEILAEKIQARGSHWILDLPGVYEHLRFSWLEEVIARWDCSQPACRQEGSRLPS
jgi:hypothetical protein